MRSYLTVQCQILKLQTRGRGVYICRCVDGSTTDCTSATTTGTLYNSDGNFTIGATIWGTDDLDGTIDELRLYNRALSPAEVRQLYDWAPGPVGYWNFEEGVGTSAFDSSGNGFNGVLGTGDSAPTWNVGKYGKALKFDGVNDILNVGNISTKLNTGVTNPPSYTLEGWFYKSDYAGGNIGGISLGNWSWDGRLTWSVTGGQGIGFQLKSGSTSVSQSNTPFGWHHGAGVYNKDENLIKLYVDGILIGQATPVDVNLSGTGGMYVRIGNAQQYYKGLIDEVKIYNYARTQKQIVEDMLAGAPASSNKSPLARYTFDEGYGTTVYDSGQARMTGGTPLNGTLGSGTSAPAWSNDGKFGKALSFDGNDWVSFPDVSY